MALINNLNANFKQLSEENKVNNGYLTGGVSTEKKMFEQVKEMKRSTFDLSKFTVVGTPTITEDGIASGFSSNNFLRTSTIDFSKPWEIDTIFTVDGATGNSMLWAIQGGGWYNYIFHNLSQIQIGIMLPDNTEHILRINYTFSANIPYICKVLWTGTSYYLRLYNNDGTLIEEKHYDSSLVLLQTSGYIQIGYGSYNNYAHKGSIDLSQFSITVDGVEVFNGNKTGIDQIKKDNYTKVGDVVVSDDGIASGFNGGSYLTIPSNITSDVNKVSVEMEIEAIGVGGAHPVFLANTLTNHPVKIGSNNILGMYTGIWTNGVTKYNTGDVIDIKVEYDKFKQTYTLYSRLKGAYGWVTEVSAISSTNIFGNVFYIGRNATTVNEFYEGKIDVNAIKIYLDDNLIIQPCLKIPYTQSKTCSKIVDAIYRDRVQDMYNSFGYAPYYTLSETDFTLPMGEIYGMKADKAELDGQWVGKRLTLANTVTVTSTDAIYDISDYLPNDNNIYEVFVSTSCNTDNILNHFSRNTLRTDIIYNASITQARNQVANLNNNTAGSIILPVGKNRQIIWVGNTSTNFGGTYTISLEGYRKVK